MSACKDIGTRQAHKAKLRTIGTTADRFGNRGNTQFFHRTFGYFYNMHHRFDFFTHIVILVFYFGYCYIRDLLVKVVYNLLYYGFAFVEKVAVVVADDKLYYRIFYISRNIGNVVEPFATFGASWNLIGW